VSGYFYAPAALRREVIPVLTKYEAGWDTKPVWRFWKREKCLAATEIRAPDRPLCSLIATLTTKGLPYDEGSHEKGIRFKSFKSSHERHSK